MTLPLPPESDEEFRVEKISHVKREKDGYEIGLEVGCLFVPFYGTEPKVGDLARLYGKGFGYSVRGLVIGSYTAWYRTPVEEEDRQRQWVLDHHKRQREEFEREKSQLDAAYASLHPALQKRITRLRDKDPDFRWRSEAYEMFACTEAMKIMAACKTPEKVQEFANADWETQKKLVPDLDEGHSGNTFHGACRLAYGVLAGKEV